MPPSPFDAVIGPYLSLAAIAEEIEFRASLSDGEILIHIDRSGLSDPDLATIGGVSDEEQAARDAAKELELRLLWAFENEPLEDGMDHLGEELIEETLNHRLSSRLLPMIARWCVDEDQPCFAADVFRCLGRQEHPGTWPWRRALIERGLRAEDVEIRDAAAVAASMWEERGIVPILEAHSEAVPWLARFIRDVIEELQ